MDTTGAAANAGPLLVALCTSDILGGHKSCSSESLSGVKLTGIVGISPRLFLLPQTCGTQQHMKATDTRNTSSSRKCLLLFIFAAAIIIINTLEAVFSLSFDFLLLLKQQQQHQCAWQIFNGESQNGREAHKRKKGVPNL